MIEQAAQVGLAGDVGRVCREVRIWIIKWDAVINALMRTVIIVMTFNRLEYIPEMPFAEEDELIQGCPCRTDESFRVGIALRGMGRGFDNAANMLGHGGVKRFEEDIAVVNEYYPMLVSWQ